MADRDVKLIIRAKNEATRTIESVSGALKDLDKAQKTVGSSASKTDDLIGRLGQEFQKLNSQVTALGALNKVAGFLDRAGTAVNNLKQGVSGAEAKFGELSRAAGEAAAATQQLEQRANELRERQKQQRSEMEAARKATLRNADAQKELTAARKAYNAALKVAAGKEGRDAGIASTKAALDAAQAAVNANVEAYTRLKSTYTQTKQEAGNLDRQLRESTKSQNQLANAASDAEAALGRQRANLEKGEQEFAQLKTVVDGAASSLGNVATKQDTLASTISRLVPQVDRLGKTMAALERYSTGGGSFLDPKTASAFRAQRVEMERTEETWRTLQAEAKRLAVEMRGVAQPTEQQVGAFRQVTAAAAAAKAEYRQQQGALHALQGTAKSTFAQFAASAAPLKTVSRDLDEARKRTEALNVAMSHFSTGTGGFAGGAQAAVMRQQAEAVEVARKRYELLRTEAQRLDAQMRSSGSATAAQVQQLRNVAAAANIAEKEFREAGAALNQMQAGSRGGLFASINRESRQAMSLFQRLRGEVLSLATAYAGLYGTISNVGSVISAYQKMEAAQNRLGAVFNQNAVATRNELGWLDRQAGRLGIGFDVLADEYSKFAVAANAANFSSEATRKVFLRVAEAGRVNKLSMEQMSLIFLALQQMISKGKIQSEELRRQLGDQLPGAFNIMADAIGVTTAELDDMMKKGEVIANQSTMLKFADELNKRFGPQLAEALRSTTTQIGLFQNNLFKAQVAFANGSFIKSFTDLLRNMNKWFQSEEGVQFFLSLGAAAGRFVEVLRVVFDNVDLVTQALQILVAVKLAAWIVGIANNAVAATANLRAMSTETNRAVTATDVAAASTTRFYGAISRTGAAIGSFAANLSLAQIKLVAIEASTKALGIATSATQARLAAASVATAAWTGALGLMRGALAAARVAVTGLLSALGGPAGIAIAVGTYFATDLIAKWATEVDNATSALTEHKRLMNEIVGEYEKAGEGAKDWSQILRNLTLDQLDANVSRLSSSFDELKNKLVGGDIIPYKFWQSGIVDTAKRVNELNAQFRKGEVDATKYREELESIYSDATSDAAKEFLQEQLAIARQLEETSEALDQAKDAADRKRNAIDGLRGTLSDVKTPLEEMATAAQDNAKALEAGSEAADKYKESLDGIKGMIPELADEMKRLKEQAKLDDFVNGLGYGPRTKEQQDYIDRAQLSVDMTGVADALQEAVRLIVQKEGFSAKAYWDVNHYRVGYGSDTVTLDDGSIQKVVQGTTTSRAAAMKDLVRRIGEFQNVIKKEIGLERWNEFSKQQQAALTSIAYNYGNLTKTGILATIKSGDTKQIADAIRSTASHNGGVNAKRRRSEAALFESGEDTDKSIRAAEKRAEAEKKASEATKQRIADQQFEITQQDLKNVGKEREAAIEKAIRDAKAENPKISAEELEIIRQQTGALWDKQQLKKAEKEENKQIKEAMKEVNLLEQQRNALLATRKSYQDQGNTEKVKEVNAELAGLNTKLQEAIDKAIAMHQALGGANADATIGKLEAMKGKIVAAGDGMRTMAMTAGEMQSSIFSTLESGIISAFDSFAQAVANGEDAIQALGKAFRQFAANFLLEIAKMILKQIMFNALQSISRALTGGIMSIVAHTGGIVGQSVTGSRTVAPGWFASATRYHTGGIAGLKPNEVPAILEVGEEVLTEQDARHSKNLGKGGSDQGAPGRTKIVNMFDAASFLSEALNSAVGEEVLLNFVRANPGAFKAAMG